MQTISDHRTNAKPFLFSTGDAASILFDPAWIQQPNTEGGKSNTHMEPKETEIMFK